MLFISDTQTIRKNYFYDADNKRLQPGEEVPAYTRHTDVIQHVVSGDNVDEVAKRVGLSEGCKFEYAWLFTQSKLKQAKRLGYKFQYVTPTEG